MGDFKSRNEGHKPPASGGWGVKQEFNNIYNYRSKKMFRNFFKTAIRFFWRNKSYTILNYLCLTFGLTCAIVAALNMNRVFNYDKFHINYDRLYEVNAHVTYFNGDRFPNGILSASLPGLLEENIPEIETYSRVVDCNYEFYTANESISEQGIYAEPEFLDLFSFTLKSGSAATVLSDNNSIVISEKMAVKFFKTTDCIGRSMQIKVDSAFTSFTISGVLKDIPGQSCFQFDYILPFASYLAQNSWSMESGANACQTWVLLNRNATRKQVEEKMKDLIKFQETTLNQELFLFPLKEKILYFYSGGRRVWREMQNVVLIGSIGFAILLIACFNFINLTIALNIKRFREVGIRKVVGAQKIGVVFQQMGEAVILVLISLATSLDLVKLSVNVLYRLFNVEVHFDFGDIGIIMIFTGIGLFAAVASGMLPALYLSSPKPVEILRGTSHSPAVRKPRQPGNPPQDDRRGKLERYGWPSRYLRGRHGRGRHHHRHGPGAEIPQAGPQGGGCRAGRQPGSFRRQSRPAQDPGHWSGLCPGNSRPGDL